jgi:hypothetical protein
VRLTGAWKMLPQTTGVVNGFEKENMPANQPDESNPVRPAGQHVDEDR